MKNVFNDYVKTLETYIMFTIKAKAQELTPELTAKGRAPIYLSMGAPSDPPPKFVIDKLKEVLGEQGIHSYSTPKGEQYFLDAVAKYMKNRFNVELNPKTEIFSLIGSKEGLANVIREISNPKTDIYEQDIILIPNPGYASVKEMCKVSGINGYGIPLTKENNYMPNLDEVVEKLKKDGFDENKIKALMINYPNNPLGATATKEYLEHCVDFCRRKGILLISDAAYCDIYFDENDKPISILEIEGAKDVAVEFFSFSKPFAMTGWRLGWFCGNADAVGMIGKLKSTFDTGVFKAIQKAGAEVLNSKEGQDYCKKANEKFEKKQKILLQGFKELGWDIDTLNIPKATFYLWFPIPRKYKTSVEFCEDILKTSGIVLVPGNAFGSEGEGWFRLSVVCPDDKLQEVIDRMKQDGFYY